MSGAAARPGEGQSFRLVPFGEPASGAVEGWIQRRGEQLRLEYRLRDPAASLRVPPLAAEPRRCDGLWQATCLELFLALPGEESYREFNLSPSGDWNVYRLDAYRRGLRPDPAWTALPMTRTQGQGELAVALATHLPPELAAAAQLEAAITAVLQSAEGLCTYWALHHPGAEADFHRREGFVLRL
jgi:hypothetical protein